VAHYLHDAEVHTIVPSIRLTCTVLLSKEDIVSGGKKMHLLMEEYWSLKC